MAGGDYERCEMCDKKAVYAADTNTQECVTFHPECLKGFKAQVLREAAMQIDWNFEVFVAADGINSIRQHGKSPGELLAERAGDIEEGRL